MRAIGDLKRIAIYDGKTVTYGYTFEEIEPEIIGFFQLGYDVHIYIHNAEFDLRKIPQVFSKDRIDWENCALINRKFAKVKTKYY